MQKKKTFILLVVLIFILTVPFLCWYANTTNNNGFERNIANINPALTGNISLPDLTSLVSLTNDELLIQQRRFPFIVLKLDRRLKKIVEDTLVLPKQFTTTRKNYYYSKIGPELVVTNETGEILRLGNKSDYYKINNLKFDLSTGKSANTIFLRSYIGHGIDRHFEILKVKLNDTASVQKSFILPKQIDGIFCVDGRMIYDDKNARLYYMYYYRGEFLCLDTNLNLIYKAKTIDTVRIAKVKVKNYTEATNGINLSKNTIMSASPLVNNYFAVDADKIYIKSNLKAENQTLSEFRISNSIDVYSTNNGRYLYSFYIPKVYNSKLLEFKVRDSYFYGLYHAGLVAYDLKK